MCVHHHSLHCVLPPYVLEHLSASDNEKIRRAAIDALRMDEQARTLRTTMTMMPAMAAIPSQNGNKYRSVYTLRNKPPSPYTFPGKLLRSEGQGKCGDAAADEAYAGAGHVYDFYLKQFERNSLDDRGMALISSVHVGKKYNNAFWNGEQMAYGDGDDQLFRRFTRSLDVIAHELTHGVVTHTCNLQYQDQSGALNEHFADVFGCLVKQWRNTQTAKQASWLIGEEIMGPGTQAKSLRALTGDKAYADDPLLGTDPQPKHMDDFVNMAGDNGGVHYNSGIPNHAFYLAAMKTGGKAWSKMGSVWYQTMQRLTSTSQFNDAAIVSIESAGELFGRSSAEQKAVSSAWAEVGISP